MQIHFHDSVYNDCFSVPTNSKGVINAAAKSAVALQARASDTTLTQTDRSVRKCIGITSAAFMHGRQSTHVEDSLHNWKTVNTCENSLHMWKTVYNLALTRGKHTSVLMKHHSSFKKSMMAPGDWLELSIKVEGGEGVDAILHCFAHGWMAQDAPNLRWFHVLNRHTCYMHQRCD